MVIKGVCAQPAVGHSGYYDSMVFSHVYTDKYPVYIEALFFKFPSGDLNRGPLDHKSTELPTQLPCFGRFNVTLPVDIEFKMGIFIVARHIFKARLFGLNKGRERDLCHQKVQRNAL